MLKDMTQLTAVCIYLSNLGRVCQTILKGY